MGGMGFRDMELFNHAMLGKQCWSYFSNCTFWDAPRPRSSSFTWRSLIYGKEILMKGILWRVGNGKTICINKDKWVQSTAIIKPVVHCQKI
jgi:hypothetical protein